MNDEKEGGKNIYAEEDFLAAVDQNHKRRVYARRPKRARDLVNDIVTRRGIAAEKSNYELQNLWDKIVGIDIANQTRVGSIRRGVLEINVANSSVMQLISFNQNEFLKKINQQVPKADIQGLRFRIGSIS